MLNMNIYIIHHNTIYIYVLIDIIFHPYILDLFFPPSSPKQENKNPRKFPTVAPPNMVRFAPWPRLHRNVVEQCSISLQR